MGWSHARRTMGQRQKERRKNKKQRGKKKLRTARDGDMQNRKIGATKTKTSQTSQVEMKLS